MNKKYIMIILLVGFLSISGCAKTYTSTIKFDEYIVTIKTSSTGYHETNDTANQNIYKAFIPKDQTGFVHSLLVRKSKDDGLPIEKLITLNMEKNKRKLPGFTDIGGDNQSFTCHGETIEGYKESYTINAITPKETIYINQYFFKRDGYLYIVSTSTEEKDKNKQLNKALSSIQCNEPTKNKF